MSYNAIQCHAMYCELGTHTVQYHYYHVLWSLDAGNQRWTRTSAVALQNNSLLKSAQLVLKLGRFTKTKVLDLEKSSCTIIFPAFIITQLTKYNLGVGSLHWWVVNYWALGQWVNWSFGHFIIWSALDPSVLTTLPPGSYFHVLEPV